MAEDQDPAAAARSEAARQLVGIAGMAVTILAAAWIERKTTEPDAWRTLRMRAAKRAERAAARVAGRCWRLAEAARRVYERDSA